MLWIIGWIDSEWLDASKSVVKQTDARDYPSWALRCDRLQLKKNSTAIFDVLSLLSHLSIQELLLPWTNSTQPQLRSPQNYLLLGKLTGLPQRKNRIHRYKCSWILETREKDWKPICAPKQGLSLTLSLWVSLLLPVRIDSLRPFLPSLGRTFQISYIFLEHQLTLPRDR